METLDKKTVCAHCLEIFTGGKGITRNMVEAMMLAVSRFNINGQVWPKNTYKIQDVAECIVEFVIAELKCTLGDNGGTPQQNLNDFGIEVFSAKR